MAKAIPGPPGRFLVGNAGQIDTGKLHVSFYDLMKEYGKIYKLSLFSERFVVISGLSLMEKALNKEELCHRPYSFLRKVKYNENGIIGWNFGPVDKKLMSVVHKALLTVVDDNVVQDLLESDMNRFLESLDKKGNIPITNSLSRVSAGQYAIYLTGLEPNETQRDATLEYLKALNFLFSKGKLGMLTKLPWLQYFPCVFKPTVDGIMGARDQLVASFLPGVKSGRIPGQEHGILQHMMAYQEANIEDNIFTDERMSVAVIDILTNSVIGTGSFVAFMLLQSLKYPEMQQRIHDELGKIGKVSDITDIKIEALPYMDAFILESLRFGSLVTTTFPYVVGEDTDLDGYALSKGTNLIVSLYNAHHDDDTWDKPWEFNPNRFLDDQGQSLPLSHPQRKFMIQFGRGIRQCRGETIAMGRITRLMLGIFYRYKVLPPLDSDLPSADPRDYPSTIIIDMPQFYCRFEKKSDVKLESSYL